MSKENFKIVFMGTPEFATCILDKLIKENFNIVAIVTAPDKPAGRGQKLAQSDVKKFAIQTEIPLLQPTNLKDEDFVNELKSFDADLFVVVAFRMLPEVVWQMPKKGTINLHASLLPNYRGAAPINWAVMNGDTTSGVSTFFIEKEIDTGMIIQQERVSIGENETVGELYNRLMHLGASVTTATVNSIIENKTKPIPQNELIDEALKPAPKIFKPMCKIDWSKSVEINHNFCRGLSPYPTAWTVLHNPNKKTTKSFKIFETRKTTIRVTDKESLKADKEGVLIPCNDFYLRIIELQPEGKRRMNFKEVLAGYQIEEWKVK